MATSYDTDGNCVFYSGNNLLDDALIQYTEPTGNLTKDVITVKYKNGE